MTPSSESRPRIGVGLREVAPRAGGLPPFEREVDQRIQAVVTRAWSLVPPRRADAENARHPQNVVQLIPRHRVVARFQGCVAAPHRRMDHS